MNRARKIKLSDEDRQYILKLSRSRTEQVQTVQRAKILLQKADGLRNADIANNLEININSVRLCVTKYESGGLENALYDAPGRGRNAEITEEEKTWVINIACQRPYDLGLSSELWTITNLTSYINETAEESGHLRLSTLSRTSVHRILSESEIKPHKIRYYCEKRDPEFESKMNDVLLVYKQIEMRFDEHGNLIPFDDLEEKINTISYDEKTGIQAIANTSQDKMPIISNGYRQRDYEYKRLGTVSLLAGLDLLTGEAIPLVSATHKSSDFIKFLKLLDAKYPEDEKIRLILDNHSSHTSKETRKFLEEIPNRFEFVFTPTHGSWLNIIESFFSKMTRQTLKGIRVASKDELVERIYMYFDEINKSPVVFRWKYKMKDTSAQVG